MNNIHWLNNAVCYAKGKQWFVHTESSLMHSAEYSDTAVAVPFDWLVKQSDFQLNKIRTGDFIPASELDTEQKYNDVVEVFGLFAHESDSQSGYEGLLRGKFTSLTIRKTGFSNVKLNFDCKRQLTYHQIIAIGKLKRMMLEREKAEPELTTDNVKNPSHYQLVDGVESIEIIARSMTQEQFKGYCLGNTLKYRLRAGKKDALQQDIDKANFYGELYEMHKEKCYD